MIVSLLALAAAIAYFATREGNELEREQAIAPTIAPTIESSESSGHDTRGAMTQGSADGQDSKRPINSDRAASGVAPKFFGQGSIRGLVQAKAGSKLPELFTIHIGPSDSLHGRHLAVSQFQETGEAEFSFPDIPLGGYDVWVDAKGLNARRNPILLTQAAPHPYIVLSLGPTGFLDGYVTKHNGQPAEDLPVTLKGMFVETRLETRTRPDGFYLFDDVPDGEFTIHFGPENQPLVPERQLVFQSPSMRFPKTELPTTVDVLLHTTNHRNEAVGEVTLTGFGKPKGILESTTNSAGIVLVRNLPPGRYRVAARNEQGLKANITLEIKDEASQEFWIALR